MGVTVQTCFISDMLINRCVFGSLAVGYSIPNVFNSGNIGLRKMETTLDKAGIVHALYSRLGCSRKEAQDAVEVILETIKEKLEQGEDVRLSGFGKFVVRSKRSRVGRNPKTGDTVEITARRVLTFKPSAILREKVKIGE